MYYLAVAALALYWTVLPCCGQLGSKCEEIKPNGFKQYSICSEGPISLVNARYRYNISIDPEDFTCGATSQTYCNQELPPLCDTCDENVAGKEHTLEYMVDMAGIQPNIDTWWQSKTWFINPTQPLAANITLSFDHLYELQNLVSITFKSGRPTKMALLVSDDFGGTWRALRYYQKNCDDRYSAGVPSTITAADPEVVTCETKYSTDTPYVNGAVQMDITNEIFSIYLGETLTDFPELHAAFNRTTLNQFLSFTDIRLQLLVPSTGGSSQRDRASLIKYYYAISDISVQASCSCNLHAGSCSQRDGRTVCDCQHHTDGTNCEKCLPLYNNKPWKPGFYAPYPLGIANPCEKCECYDHTDNCTYDPALNFGVCNDCLHNTTGLKCEQCQEGFFPNASAAIDDVNRCIACDCEPLGVIPGNMKCESVTGQCFCKSLAVGGRQCNLCSDGTYGLLLNDSTLGTCKFCACVKDGTLGASTICEKASGQCTCKPNVGQRGCNQCKDGFYGFPTGRPSGDCFDCQCDPGGSINPTCDKNTGQCPCRFGVAGRQCNRPITDTFAPFLDYFHVQPSGGTCMLDTSLLTSPIPFTGRVFSKCEATQLTSFGEIDGKQLQPEVTWSFLPSLRYSLESDVPWSTATLTITQLGDSGIDMTSYRTRANDQTVPANCNPDLSLPVLRTIQITDLSPGTGLAWISPTSVTLDARCRYRTELTVGDPGKVNDTLIVDSIVYMPGHNKSVVYQQAEPDVQRDLRGCEQRLMALTTRQMAQQDTICNGFVSATTLQMGAGAQPCGCDSQGTVPGTTCETKGGQCQCKQGVYGRKCEVCQPGFYNKTLQGCTSCDCNEKGSTNLVCDYLTGQCPCHPNVATATEQNVLGLQNDLKCSSCIVNYHGHVTGQGCEACGCDVTGTNMTQCDDAGQCECKPTIGGAKCDVCLPGYYLFTSDGCSLCNCSMAGSLGIECDQTTGQCACKQNMNALKCDVCVVGSFNLEALNPDGCQKCFCYGHGTTCQSAPGYSTKRLVADQAEIQTWKMIDPFGTSILTHYVASERFLGNRLTSYGTYLSFTAATRGGAFVDYSSEDSFLLVGDDGEMVKYNSTDPMVASSNQKQFFIDIREHLWYYNATTKPDYFQFYRILADLTGIYVQRQFRSNVVDVMAFGMSTTQLAPPGAEQVNFVEQCTCLGTSFVDGLSCERCAQGYKRPVVNGSSYETCIACDCNNDKAFTNPPMCDENTGECLNCKNGTSGTQCEDCAPFVDTCAVCTDEACGQCTNDYWGMSQDGCQACDCDTVGSTSTVCDKASGSCTCRPNVGERPCDQCVDNYFGLSAAGCSVCDDCYSLVKTDVDKLREIRDNMTQLVSDLRTNDATGNVGPFGPRLRETQTNMQWLLLYLSEAEAVQTDTMAEVQRLNGTLIDLGGLLATTGIKLDDALSDVMVSDNITEVGRNTTGDIQFSMVEANAVLNANTVNATRDIEALLSSIQQVQQKMAGVSNDAIGDILRVSGVVNTIQSGSAQAKSTADEAYLTAQNGQNTHRQTTSGASILDQFVLTVSRLRDDISKSATYALGNASNSLAIANLALSNATNMAPIATDVTSLINKATLLVNEAQGLKSQSDTAVVNAATTITTVNNAATSTNIIMGNVNALSGRSGLLQMRLDDATQQVSNARLLASKSFVDAGRMLEIMRGFKEQVQTVQTQADAALAQVQEIQKLGEESISNGRTLQQQLQTPLDRTQRALQTATTANQISAENNALFNESFQSVTALGNYSDSVLNDVSIYPAIASNINNTIVTPAGQKCTEHTQQKTQLQATTTTVVTTANNASQRVSETTSKINSILQSFQNVANIDQTKLATLRTMYETTKASFNKELLTDTVNRLKTAMDQQRLDLQNMKQRKGQLQTQIRRLRDIQQQLRTV